METGDVHFRHFLSHHLTVFVSQMRISIQITVSAVAMEGSRPMNVLATTPTEAASTACFAVSTSFTATCPCS